MRYKKDILPKDIINFGSPAIGKDEIRAVKRVIDSKWIGSGPVTENFERKFKNYKNAKIGVSLNSCTAAMHLSLLALNIAPGDEVITTPLTFCSTINSILLVGAVPILADIKPDTLNIDEEKIINKITKKTSLRQRATASSKVLKRLKVGTEVKVIDQVDRYWSKVILNGEIGYVKVLLLEKSK